MGTWKPHIPNLELLEAKALMSAGASTSPPAGVRSEPGIVMPPLSFHDDVSEPSSAHVKRVEVRGQVTGIYTSTQGAPGTGMPFRVNASGTITPIGPAVVTGSFDAAAGTLTISGPEGKLYLVLTATSPVSDGISTSQAGSINPGGPMIPESTGTSQSTIGQPIILVNSFRFEITSGAGQYAHDRGRGTVQIETTPVLWPPAALGIYSSSLATDAPTGRTTLTFARA